MRVLFNNSQSVFMFRRTPRKVRQFIFNASDVAAEDVTVVNSIPASLHRPVRQVSHRALASDLRYTIL
jgi:hypothetical protein